jgi:hypothetical protein
LLEAIASLSEGIREYNQRIEALAEQSYPEVALLKVQRKNKRTHLTPTGLLMEGLHVH